MNTKEILKEAQALLTEAIFNHRWVLLQGYHDLGRLLVENNISVQEVDFHRKKDIHYAIELFKKYPDVNSVPEGKNVSWYKITKTLPAYEKER
jgi:hypothetical protein